MVCGVLGGSFRTQSLKATLVSLGYFNWRTQDARQPPWLLCSGDLDSNLDEVTQGPKPSQPFMRQLYGLLQVGCPREHLKSLLQLVEDASKSNIEGEQAHACASSLRRKRPSYEADTLQSRSQLLQMRPLLSKDLGDKKIEALEAKLERLTKASSKHFTGRQALSQDLSRTSKHPVGLGKQGGAGEQKRILSMHGQL